MATINSKLKSWSFLKKSIIIKLFSPFLPRTRFTPQDVSHTMMSERERERKEGRKYRESIEKNEILWMKINEGENRKYFCHLTHNQENVAEGLSRIIESSIFVKRNYYRSIEEEMSKKATWMITDVFTYVLSIKIIIAFRLISRYDVGVSECAKPMCVEWCKYTHGVPTTWSIKNGNKIKLFIPREKKEKNR